VFIRDTSRPVTRKCMLEGFRFANTLKRISHGLFYHGIYAAKDFPVGGLPKEIVFPGVVGKNELHSINPFSAPSPFSSWAIDSNNLLVFLGDLKR
jgi:hypothetical protein